LKKGLNINSITFEGISLLSPAVNYNRLHIAKFLISKGLSVNHVDKGGWTPIYLCNSKEMAELLISVGPL